jgi:hypothetical protein
MDSQSSQSQDDVVQDTDLHSIKQGDSGQSVTVGKEQEPASVKPSEVVRVIEHREEAEVPPEVESWMERVERGESKLPGPVTHQGQTLVQPAEPEEVKIVLPLTEEEVNQGLHRKIWESVRWLAVWCVRVMKKLGGRVIYSQT